MGRASEAQKAERLNRARTCYAHFDQLPDAVEQLAQDCSISPRQAYRYLQQAQRLKEPVPVSESKLAFTVKLPHSLIQRVRLYASVKESVHQRSRQPGACWHCCHEGEGVAEPRQARHATFGWNIDLIVCWQTSWHKSYQAAGAGKIDGDRLEQAPNHQPHPEINE